MKTDLLRTSDLCVKCGLCLPYCPTYRKTGNENESPRGRIALIQGWASDELKATKKLQAHIDQCLLCRTCERVCPAEVPYGLLVDEFRSETRSQRPFRINTALMKWIAGDKRLANRFSWVLKVYRDKGLQSLLRRFGLLRWPHWSAIDRLLPTNVAHDLVIREIYPAIGDNKGKVGLFMGCLSLALDPETIEASLFCLRAAGFEVHIPREQGCCGAMHQHDGDSRSAAAMADKNCRAFADPELSAIVSIASGCGSQLKEYRQSLFAEKIFDVSQFLSQQGIDFGSRIKPLGEAVCLHSPCSLRNVMNQELGPRQILQQIPGIRLIDLPGEIQCCGAAGTYMLEHPTMAGSLADDVLTAVSETGVRMIATSNFGCALHLSAAARRRGLSIEVMHPLTLMARQLNAK